MLVEYKVGQLAAFWVAWPRRWGVYIFLLWGGDIGLSLQLHFAHCPTLYYTNVDLNRKEEKAWMYPTLNMMIPFLVCVYETNDLDFQSDLFKRQVV